MFFKWFSPGYRVVPVGLLVKYCIWGFSASCAQIGCLFSPAGSSC